MRLRRGSRAAEPRSIAPAARSMLLRSVQSDYVAVQWPAAVQCGRAAFKGQRLSFNEVEEFRPLLIDLEVAQRALADVYGSFAESSLAE